MSNNNKTPAIRFKGFIYAWEQRKLGELMEIASVKRIHQSDWTNSGVRFLRARDIVAVSKNEEVSEPLFISQEKYDEYSALSGKVKIGDLLVTGVGTIGVPMLINNEEPLYFKDGNIIWFKNEDRIDGKFFYHSFNGSFIQNFIKESAGIGTVGTYTIESGKKTPILLPTQKDEQQKIGTFFSQLDTLITFHQRKYDKLTQFKAAMLEKMFPQNGADKPEIRFKGFTDAWEQRKFSELTEIRSASRVHKDEWQSSGVPFYRSSDVMAALNGTENEKAFISEELYEKLSAVSGKLEKGDVLVTGGGSVGKPYIVPNNEPLYTKDADLLWIKNNENLDPYFVYTFFFSPTFTDYLNSVSHVGTIAHYTITQLGETPITLPCVSEQQKIGDYFRNLDFLITLHQRKCDKYKSIKSGLLKKLFP